MSLKNQISLGFVAILLLTFISLGTLVFYLNKLGNNATNVLEYDYRSVKASEEMVISLVKIDRILSKVCLSDRYNETALLEVLNREVKLVKSHLDLLSESLLILEEQEILSKIRKQYERYSRHMREVYTNVDRKTLYFSVLQRQHEILLDRCLGLTFTNHEAIKEKDKATQSLYFRAKMNTFLVTTLVFLLVLGFIYRMPGEIVRPIKEMTRKVKEVIQGEFSQNVEARPSELVELARSFNLAGKKLQETEEKFWLITSNLYDVVFFTRLDQGVFYTTPSVSRHLGYRPEDILGGTIHFMLHPEDEEIVKTTLSEVVKMPYQRNIPFSVRLRKKDGKYIWVEADFIVQTDPSDQPAYLQITFRDITERKLAEQKIMEALSEEKRLNEQLTKAHSEIDQFVYSTSHNLRGPLASILGIVNLLKQTKEQNERIMLLELTEKSIHKMDETIHEITDYARNNRLELQCVSIDFEAIIQDVIESLQYLPAMQTLAINCDIEKKIHFESDPSRLKVIFNNLISNAVKYQNPDQSHSYLNIKISFLEKNIVIHFQDNGIGVEKKYQERIFDMFYRATELSTGSGLGLYIVKETVEKLKGHIAVSSIFRKGTDFIVEIPDFSSKHKNTEIQNTPV